MARLGWLQCQSQHGRNPVRLNIRLPGNSRKSVTVPIAFPTHSRVGHAWWLFRARQGLLVQRSVHWHQHFLGLLRGEHRSVAGLTGRSAMNTLLYRKEPNGTPADNNVPERLEDL